MVPVTPVAQSQPTTAGRDSAAGVRFGTLSDIDGNIYRTVIFGRQEWMAENLRATRLNDGTPISLVADDAVWSTLTTPAFAWYENDERVNKTAYGALYNWSAVGTGKLAPTGWRVPSHNEWTNFLTKVLGGKSITGGQVLLQGELKSTRAVPDAHPRWNEPNADATNGSGFSALPGGHRSHVGLFNYLGNFGFWWTSTTANPANYAAYLGMRYDNGHVFVTSGNKKNGFSVRCVRDVP